MRPDVLPAATDLEVLTPDQPPAGEHQWATGESGAWAAARLAVVVYDPEQVLRDEVAGKSAALELDGPAPEPLFLRAERQSR